MGGVGLASQFSFLRFSNGNLGFGGISGGLTTKQEVFDIQPSLQLGAGLRYRITEKINIDMRISTLQIFSDINTRQLNLHVGAKFFF